MSVDILQPCPEVLNLTRYCLEDSVQRFPDKTALIFTKDIEHSQSWTYREVWKIVNQMALRLLALDLPKQSRILLRLPSSPEYAFVLLGAILAGHIPIPSYEGLKEEETLFLIKDSQSALLIASSITALPKDIPSYCKILSLEALQNKISASKEIHPCTRSKDPAFLVYTSGTTAHPKGVLHGHQMIWGRRAIRKCLLDISDKDTLLHTDTLNFTYTFGVQIFDVFASGATSLMYGGEKTPENWLKLLQTYQVTIFASCPSSYVEILKHTSKELSCKALRHCISAGDILPLQIVKAWEKRFKVPLYNALGMTEINLFISSGPFTPLKEGSIGKPQEGRRVAVLSQKEGVLSVPSGQVGLLAIHRGDPGLMLGYWHREEEEKATRRGEWFLTGDLVHQDLEGYIFYHGRIGSILNIDADVVSPYEVEAIFKDYPGIQEVGCWAIPGPNQTLILSLFVIPKKDGSLDKQALLCYAKEHLADYKCPKKVFFLKSFPKDRRGKLIRRQLPSMI